MVQMTDASSSRWAKRVFGFFSARQAMRLLPIIVPCALVLGFYFWTAVTDGVQVFPDGSRQTDFTKRLPVGQFPAASYYNLLGDAFMAGKLSLLIDPPKELLDLPDPYGPEQNRTSRIPDATLYNGKYYLCWGPTPAVILYLPFRVLHLGSLPDALAVLILGYGGFIWTVLLLRHLTRTYLPATPAWLEALAILSLGLCNFVPFLLRWPAVYQAAIACSYFLLTGGIYFLFLGYHRRQSWQLMLASLLFGLSIGARATDALAGLLLLVVWLLICRNRHRWKLKPAVRDALYLSVPFLACLFLLGLYNFARFGSWGEFGNRYQLGGGYGRNAVVRFFQLGNIWPGLENYFFQPCRIVPLFPFFELKAEYPGVLPEGIAAEGCGGVLTNLPIMFMILLIPLLLARRRKDKEAAGLIVPICCIAAFSVLLAAAISFTIPATTMRYAADFAPILMVAALIVWFYVDGLLTQRWSRIPFRAVTLLALGYTLLFSLGLSMNGPLECLKYGDPPVYRSLQQKFLPVSNFLVRFTGPKQNTVIDIVSPEGTPRLNDGSPVLCIGKEGVTLSVYVAEPSTARLDALCMAGPALPRDQFLWHMLVRNNGAQTLRQAMVVPQSIDLKFPLERGFNVIELDLEEKGKSIVIHPDGQPGTQLLVGLAHVNLQFEK